MTADRVPMDRRELFKILGAGLAANRLAAQHHDPDSSEPVDIASYQPRFLSPIQYQTVDRLCELLIPADEMGPGAHQAGVPFYIVRFCTTLPPRSNKLGGEASAELNTRPA